MIRTFRNNKFVKRNYDCTNILFCQAKNKPEPKENWYECDASEIEQRNCTQLYVQAGIKYFGYL